MSYQDESFDFYDQSKKLERETEIEHYKEKLEEADVPEEFWHY